MNAVPIDTVTGSTATGVDHLLSRTQASCSRVQNYDGMALGE